MSSVLALNNEFPILNNEDVAVVYRWLKEKVVVVDITSKIPVLIYLMSQDHKLQQFADEMLKGSDLNINSFFVQEQSFDEWIVSHQYDQIRNFVEQHVKDAGSGMVPGQLFYGIGWNRGDAFGVPKWTA
jgi:hypothetical protein